MITCATDAVESTRAIAATLAGLTADGDLIALVGGLGAGKTAFTQGFAAALGITDRVTSPTFTLANRYEGRLVLNHLDVYRMEGAADSRDLGIDELLDDGVTIIEWADVILEALPGDRLDIKLSFGDGDGDRVLELSVPGDSWPSRRAELSAALEPWTISPKGPQC